MKSLSQSGFAQNAVEGFLHAIKIPIWGTGRDVASLACRFPISQCRLEALFEKVCKWALVNVWSVFPNSKYCWVSV